jgi:hypothetical protein
VLLSRLVRVPEFLKLSKDEQTGILSEGGARTGRLPNVLEKDVWVCWVLDRLFRMPGALQMAFKGGTSLSKAYRSIARFSEDIDVTIDYRALTETDPFSLSKNKQNELRKELQGKVAEHVKTLVVPYFRKELDQEFGEDTISLDIQGAQADIVVVGYPSALEGGDGYVKDTVRIEFGGRNVTDPKSVQNISSDLAEHFTKLDFPRAQVPVLHLERTFWEKATLIHVACCDGTIAKSAERLSRHWYDLERLYGSERGQAAAKDIPLLQDVLKHKGVFFPEKAYDDCLKGELRLVPDGDSRSKLEADYRAMVDAGMFYEAPPKPSELFERLGRIAAALNETIKSRGGR